MQILHGKAISSEDYQRYTICKRFGWDFYTYESQPNWFIEQIMLIMYQEGQKEEADRKRAQSKSKLGTGLNPRSAGR